MTERATDEPHRVSSPLELLFDLTFVVAVSGLTAQLGVPFLTIAVGGLVLLFAPWWLYFLEPSGRGLADNRDRSYFWGYGHYGIFAALAALGAGLAVAVEQTGRHLEVDALVVAYAVAVPVGGFLLLLWAVHAPIVPRPAVILTAGVLVVPLPLAVPAVGLAAVVAAVAVTVALVTVTTLLAPSVAGRE